MKELKKLSVKQIYLALRGQAEPEIAALASWYVFHNYRPKKNISYIYSNLEKVKRVKLSQETIDAILLHYSNNRITGQTMALLPK